MLHIITSITRSLGSSCPVYRLSNNASLLSVCPLCSTNNLIKSYSRGVKDKGTPSKNTSPRSTSTLKRPICKSKRSCALKRRTTARIRAKSSTGSIPILTQSSAPHPKTSATAAAVVSRAITTIGVDNPLLRNELTNRVCGLSCSKTTKS